MRSYLLYLHDYKTIYINVFNNNLTTFLSLFIYFFHAFREISHNPYRY